jgi:hypothetical protein
MATLVVDVTNNIVVLSVEFSSKNTEKFVQAVLESVSTPGTAVFSTPCELDPLRASHALIDEDFGIGHLALGSSGAFHGIGEVELAKIAAKFSLKLVNLVRVEYID